LPVKSDADIEDRWLTIIYTIEESYKTLHVIAPTADILRQWYDTLTRLRQLRLEFMAGVFHSTMQSTEVWNRHHFAGADKSGDKRLDFQEVKSLCRRLNFGGKESEIRRKFDEADKEHNKSLSYDEFRDFVAKLKERPELTEIFKETKGDGEFTFSTFESFMKTTQKVRFFLYIQSSLRRSYSPSFHRQNWKVFTKSLFPSLHRGLHPTRLNSLLRGQSTPSPPS
jgi:phosphatidylinositol phospholipase C, delta